MKKLLYLNTPDLCGKINVKIDIVTAIRELLVIIILIKELKRKQQVFVKIVAMLKTKKKTKIELSMRGVDPKTGADLRPRSQTNGPRDITHNPRARGTCSAALSWSALFHSGFAVT